MFGAVFSSCYLSRRRRRKARAKYKVTVPSTLAPIGLLLRFPAEHPAWLQTFQHRTTSSEKYFQHTPSSHTSHKTVYTLILFPRSSLTSLKNLWREKKNPFLGKTSSSREKSINSRYLPDTPFFLSMSHILYFSEPHPLFFPRVIHRIGCFGVW